VKIYKIKFGFIRGKEKNDTIFILRQLLKKYREGLQAVFYFVNQEKAFNVP